MSDNTFCEDVRAGKVLDVRIMMKDSLLLDPSFAEFSKMEKIARSMPGLYDEHDGSAFITDRSLWNDDYMNELMVQILDNFSPEQIAHLKEVVRYLHPSEKEVPASSNFPLSTDTPSNSSGNDSSRSYQAQKKQDQYSGRYQGKKIGTGVVVGAVVGGTVAYAVGTAVAVGVAVGAVAGGVVAVASQKR